MAMTMDEINAKVAEVRRRIAERHAESTFYKEPRRFYANSLQGTPHNPHTDKERDYAKEYRDYHSKPEQIENRAKRNAARAELGLKKGDPREADHIKPLSKGGGNGEGNLRAVSRETNRHKGAKTED